MPSDPGYNVSMSGAVRGRLDRAHDAAAADGRRTPFLAALRTIVGRLRDDPTAVGEEL